MTNSSIPLCIMQEQLLLSRDLVRDRVLPPTVVPMLLRIRGDLDHERLQKAINAIVRRHEALRASFHESPSYKENLVAYASTGIVHPGAYVQEMGGWEHMDLRSYEPVSEHELHDLVGRELACPFEKAVPVRLRASLFRLTSDEHLLLLVLDHVGSDGLSVRAIERDLLTFYSGNEPEPLTISYSSFAKLQHERMAAGGFERELRYWKTQWKEFGDLRITHRDFPFGEAASSKPPFQYGSYRVTLDQTQTSSIWEVTRKHRITLFMLFVAAYARVLSDYIGRKRFPIWTHFNNRVQPEVQRVVGYLINTHIIGLDLARCDDILQEVRRAVLASSTHQELPLPYLWHHLGTAPRFRDSFVMLDVRRGYTTAHDGMSPLPIRLSRAELPQLALPRLSDLGVYVTDNIQTMDIAIVYSRDRFTAGWIESMMTQLLLELSRF